MSIDVRRLDIIPNKVYTLIAESLLGRLTPSWSQRPNAPDDWGGLKLQTKSGFTAKGENVITVGMNYEIIEGKEKEFEAVFAKVLEVMDKMDGHVKTHLYHGVVDPSSYLIISEWSSRDTFDVFTSSQQFKNVTDWGKSKILASQPKHEIYGAETAPSQGCPVRTS